MNMFFIICTVFGVTILACQTTLTVLGFGECTDFPDGELDQRSQTQSDLNGFEAIDGDSELVCDTVETDACTDVKSSRRGMNRVRAMGVAVTFFGLMGSAAEASHFTKLQTFGTAGFVAGVAWIGASFLSSQLALQLFDENHPQDVVTHDIADDSDDNPHAVSE